MIDTHVTAEDAPLCVQLWPTTSPKYAGNFTLALVTVDGDRVTWTYENGSERHFAKGEKVTVRWPAHTFAVTPFAATEPGALPGHQAACTCGTVLRTSLSARIAEHEGERHLEWHAKTGR